MTDVIIIGGGIAGCTTAYYLARDGVNVTLLERSALSAMASGSNAGSLHAQIQPEPFLDLGESWVRQFLPALAFYKESMRLWRDIQTTLDADLEVVLSGGIVVAKNDKELRSLEDKAVFERAAGIETLNIFISLEHGNCENACTTELRLEQSDYCMAHGHPS